MKVLKFRNEEKNAAYFRQTVVKLNVEKLYRDRWRHERKNPPVNALAHAKWYRRKYDEAEEKLILLRSDKSNRTACRAVLLVLSRAQVEISRVESSRVLSPSLSVSVSASAIRFSLACVTLDFTSAARTFIKSPDLLSFQRSARPTGAARCHVPTVENAWRPEATPLSVSARSATRAISAKPGWTCR